LFFQVVAMVSIVVSYAVMLRVRVRVNPNVQHYDIPTLFVPRVKPQFCTSIFQFSTSVFFSVHLFLQVVAMVSIVVSYAVGVGNVEGFLISEIM